MPGPTSFPTCVNSPPTYVVPPSLAKAFTLPLTGTHVAGSGAEESAASVLAHSSQRQIAVTAINSAARWAPRYGRMVGRCNVFTSWASIGSHGADP